MVKLNSEFCTDCSVKLKKHNGEKYCPKCGQYFYDISENKEKFKDVSPKYGEPSQYIPYIDNGYKGQTTKQKVGTVLCLIIIVISIIIIVYIANWARNKEIFLFFAWVIFIMYSVS